MGCGFKKFSVNCDGTMTPRQPTDDAGNTTPDAPSPTHLGTTKKGNTTLEDSLMIPSEDYEYTSSQSPYTRQYSCMDSITGAFTDCGPESANTGCFDKY